MLTPQEQLEAVRLALGGTYTGPCQIEASCPLPEHKDRNPSFGAAVGAGGKLWFHCNRPECDQNETADACFRIIREAQAGGANVPLPWS